MPEEAPQVRYGGLGIFFLIVLVVHLFDVFTRMRAGIVPSSTQFMFFFLYAVIAAWAYVGPFRYDPIQKYWFVVFSAIAFFAPALAAWALKLRPIIPNIDVILTIVLLGFPIWIVFIFMRATEVRWVRLLGAIYFIFWIVILMLSNSAAIKQSITQISPEIAPGIYPGTAVRVVGQKISTGLSAWRAGLGESIAGLRRAAREYDALLKGDYYLSQVEAQKKEPLGVYIESLERADPVNYQGEPVVLWADISARTIGEPVNISFNCSAKGPDGSVRLGDVSPTKLNIMAYERHTVTCSFRSLPRGQNVVSFWAVFNFATFSYIPEHFMDRARLIEMRRQALDPLVEFDVPVKQPIATYTGGPVSIGIDLPLPPVGLDPGLPAPSLGWSLKSEWEGKISRLNKLLVYVPEGFAIDVEKEGVCNRRFVAHSPIGPEIQPGYVPYALDPKDPITTRIAELQEFQRWVSFRCALSYADPDPTVSISKLLAGAPISTRFFKISADYNFEISKKLMLDVKEPVSPWFFRADYALEPGETEDSMREEVSSLYNELWSDYSKKHFPELGTKDEIIKSLMAIIYAETRPHFFANTVSEIRYPDQLETKIGRGYGQFILDTWADVMTNLGADAAALAGVPLDQLKSKEGWIKYTIAAENPDREREIKKLNLLAIAKYAQKNAAELLRAFPELKDDLPKLRLGVILAHNTGVGAQLREYREKQRWCVRSYAGKSEECVEAEAMQKNARSYARTVGLALA